MKGSLVDKGKTGECSCQVLWWSQGRGRKDLNKFDIYIDTVKTYYCLVNLLYTDNNIVCQPLARVVM